MATFEALLALVVALVLVSWLANRMELPAPVLLIGTGALLALVPGFPRLELDPAVLFALFVPPLVYAATFQVSPRELLSRWRPILALVFTMPFLYLYGCLVGIFGGFVVALAMLSVTGPGYLHETLNAVAFNQFVFGFVKSIAFAILIGVTSCRIGLKAGRSAADVGTAATNAVVTGIVGIIALDAIFAVLANVIGL